MNVAYNCKFCHKPRVVTLDDEAIENMRQVGMTLANWIPMLCCDRCGDYRKERLIMLDCFEALALYCQKILDLPEDNNAARKRMEDKAKKRLTDQCKDWCGMVCEFFDVPVEWDRGFFEGLMKTPDELRGTMLDFERRMCERSKEPRQQPLAVSNDP